jgi:hypothetical protein
MSTKLFIYHAQNLFEGASSAERRRSLYQYYKFVRSLTHSLTHSLTLGAEPFLKTCQLCSHLRTPQRFMEPESSSPRLQEPSTGPYSEPDRSNPYCTMLGVLDHFWSQIVPRYTLKTPFRLLIGLLQSQSLTIIIPLLHWLTSQLSITASNYHTLYILTLRNSRRDLTPRIHLLRLLLKTAT